MDDQIRLAAAEDIRPALELAFRVFMKCDAPDYGPEHTERMRQAIEDRIAHPEYYLPGKRLMFVALDGNKIIGMIETYGNNRISLMFVDCDYQRQGIASKLMRRMVCELKKRGFHDVVLNSSPYGVPFYQSFGFSVVESEKNVNTPWKTPMVYVIA